MRYLFAHAHPDDEALASGALIAHLLDQGHEVFVITATRGELGEVVPGLLPQPIPTSELVARREQELAGALAELGVTGSSWLGAPRRRYLDSGMTWLSPGTAGPINQADQRSLFAAPLELVVSDLVAYAVSIGAEIIVSYDSDGGYGHPDHIQMHKAAVLAADRMGIPFKALVYAAGKNTEWFELDHYLSKVVAALNHHQTQLTVHGDEVVHSGGQKESIVLRVGLKTPSLNLTARGSL